MSVRQSKVAKLHIVDILFANLINDIGCARKRRMEIAKHVSGICLKDWFVALLISIWICKIFSDVETFICCIQTIKHCWSNIWYFALQAMFDRFAALCVTLLDSELPAASKTFYACIKQKIFEEQCFVISKAVTHDVYKQISNVWQTMFDRLARALKTPTFDWHLWIFLSLENMK